MDRPHTLSFDRNRNGARQHELTRATRGSELSLFRLKRAMPVRGHNAGAGAGGYQLPGVFLVVDLRGRGARGARAGGAIILSLEGYAIAFFRGCVLVLRRGWC